MLASKEFKDAQWEFSQSNQSKNTIRETQQKCKQAYHQFMHIVSKADMDTILKPLLPSLSGFFRYDPNADFHQQLQAKVVRHTNNYEFVDIEAKIGQFIFPRLSILNLQSKSPIHAQSNIIGRGAFSQVYKCKYGEKNIAIKCFCYSDSTDQSASKSMLKAVIQEYCLLLIASKLKVGPQMEHIFGYHIMVYAQCIEIAMQHCSGIQMNKLEQFLKLKQDLRQNLLCLHSLKIIHFDIKLQNIAFSSQFNKYVFIDFGLSKIIKESFGFKTLTQFRGTYTNSSTEMTKLYQPQTQGFVDIYYNDMHCLRTTFSQTNQLFPDKYSLHMDDDDYFLKRPQFDATSLHKVYLLKHALFQLEVQRVYTKILQENNQQIIHQLLSFVKSLNYSSKLQRIKLHLQRKIKPYQQIEYSFKKNEAKQHKDETKQEEQQNIMRLVSNICQKNSTRYYLTQLQQNNKESLQYVSNFLTNVDETHKLEYLEILSKAIELNSTNFSTPQMISFCQVAIQTLSLQINILDSRLNAVKQIAIVSMFLFEQSLKHNLEGSYFQIFLCTLHNAVILRLYTFNQLFTFYKQATKIPLYFSKKIRFLLHFNSNFRWAQSQYQQQSPIPAILQNLIQFNQQLTQKQSCHLTIKQFKLMKATLVLRFLWESFDISDSEALTEFKYDQQLFTDFKMWILYKEVHSGFAQYDTHIQQIKSLLGQKQYYSSYHFLYIHNLFIFQGFNDRNISSLSVWIKFYQRIQISQNSKTIECFKASIQLEDSCYDIMSVRRYIQFIKKLKPTNNILTFYVVRQLERILNFLYLSEKKTLIDSQIYQIYELIKIHSLVFYQMNRCKNELAYIDQLFQQIRRQLALSTIFPQISAKKLISNKRNLYIQQYRFLQKSFKENYKKYKLINNLKLLTLLSLILYYIGKENIALFLSHHIFLLVKLTKNSFLIFIFLGIFLTDILCNVPHQYRQFKEYYKVFVIAVENSGIQSVYFKIPNLTVRIIEMSMQAGIEDLFKFIKNLTVFIRANQSKENIKTFIYIVKTLNTRNFDSQSFKRSLCMLRDSLNIQQNHYYIVWHYLAQLTLRNSFKKLQFSFLKSASYLQFQVRQLIFHFILFQRIQQSILNLRKRKTRSLFSYMIRYRIVSLKKAQIRHYYQILYEWNSKSKTKSLKYIKFHHKLDFFAVKQYSNIQRVKILQYWMEKLYPHKTNSLKREIIEEK